MEHNQQIGERLRDFAREKFQTVSGLCKALGKDTSHLNRYIAGKAIPGARLQQQLREHGCDIEWLMTGVYRPVRTVAKEPEARVFASVEDLQLLKDALRNALRQVAELQRQVDARNSAGLELHIKDVDKAAEQQFGVKLRDA